jgi:hypothetical protein
VAGPDEQLLVRLEERSAGRFGGDFVAAQAGVYIVRVRANGWDFQGEQFAREKTLTALTWRDVRRPERDRPPADGLSRLVRCLLEHGVERPRRGGDSRSRGSTWTPCVSVSSRRAAIAAGSSRQAVQPRVL